MPAKSVRHVPAAQVRQIDLLMQSVLIDLIDQLRFEFIRIILIEIRALIAFKDQMDLCGIFALLIARYLPRTGMQETMAGSVPCSFRDRNCDLNAFKGKSAAVQPIRREKQRQSVGRRFRKDLLIRPQMMEDLGIALLEAQDRAAVSRGEDRGISCC